MTHKIDSGTINFGLSHPEVSLHFWLLWPMVRHRQHSGIVGVIIMILESRKNVARGKYDKNNNTLTCSRQ